MSGFIASTWNHRWQEAVTQLAKWAKEGKLQVKETFTNGFEKTPDAFRGLFEGSNIGKMVVRV